MSTAQQRTAPDLRLLVQDPPWYLPVYWTPAQLPPCPPADLLRVIKGLRRLYTVDMAQERR